MAFGQKERLQIPRRLLANWSQWLVGVVCLSIIEKSPFGRSLLKYYVMRLRHRAIEIGVGWLDGGQSNGKMENNKRRMIIN